MNQTQTRKNGKREVLTDLCRTGQWVGIIVLSTRLGCGRTAALHALTELMADGLVEMQLADGKWANTTREKLYRAVPGVSQEAVPVVAYLKQGRPALEGRSALDEQRVKDAVAAGCRTADEIAGRAKVSLTYTRKIMTRLVEAGEVQRRPGPRPATGSQRPWIFEVAP